MKSVFNAFLATGVLLAASWAQAGSLTCAGKVVQVSMHANDSFMLQLDSMDYPVWFCKPNAPWTIAGTQYTTSAETCRMLIGMFLTAKAQDKSLAVVYFDGGEVPASCNAWGPWKSANIRYFEWAD